MDSHGAKKIDGYEAYRFPKWEYYPTNGGVNFI